MRRSEFLKHLRESGCELLREGKEHSIFQNSAGKTAAVPRHNDIAKITGYKICDRLEITRPKSN